MCRWFGGAGKQIVIDNPVANAPGQKAVAANPTRVTQVHSDQASASVVLVGAGPRQSSAIRTDQQSQDASFFSGAPTRPRGSP
jgi:hypothetical protein